MNTKADRQYEDFLEKIEEFIFIEDQVEKADLIFVPGNGYPGMAEKAAQLYKAGIAPWILPSGRFSVALGKFSGVLENADKYDGTYETEWEFLCDVLKKNKVPESAVLREDQATYTYENALLSKAVTEKNGITVKKAILCCKTHHARRCLMYYQRVFPETEFMVVPVDADGITKENWRKTPEGVRAVMGEVMRGVEQFEIFMK